LDPKNFFLAENAQLNANPAGNLTKQNKIRNIYINNIGLLIGLLHYAFDEEVPVAYQPNTNLNYGDVLPAAGPVAGPVAAQLPLEQNINIPANETQANSINEFPQTVYNKNFNLIATDINPAPSLAAAGNQNLNVAALKTWLFNLHLLDQNITNAKYDETVGARLGNIVNLATSSHANFSSDNENSQVLPRIVGDVDRETTITTLPYGLLDIQQGCLVNVIKWIGNQINLQFNKQFTSDIEYKDIISKMSELLKMFKSTVLVLIRYQLFCAIPCTELQNQLLAEINSYKFNYKLVPIRNQTLTLIQRMNQIIHEQKMLRARSVAQVLIDNYRIFSQVYSRLEQINSTHGTNLELAKSSHIIFKLIDLYKNQNNLPPGPNYSKYLLDEQIIDQINYQFNPDGTNIVFKPKFKSTVTVADQSSINTTLSIGGRPMFIAISPKNKVPKGTIVFNKATCLHLYQFLLEKFANTTNPIQPWYIFKLMTIMEEIKQITNCSKNIFESINEYLEQIIHLQEKGIYELFKTDTNIDLDKIKPDISNYLFDPKNPEDPTESDPNYKKKYLASLIDRSMTNYIVATHLNKVTTEYNFASQPYYTNALNKFGLEIPDESKYKIVTKIIHNAWEKLIIDQINRLIDQTIFKIIEKSATEVISLEVLNNIDFSSEIKTYLPAYDYSFGFNTFASKLVDSIEKISSLDPTLQYLDIDLIEDEDYNLYQNLIGNQIQIQKSYPIFYSYNYDSKDTNFDCVIIDPLMIEMLIKKADINIKDHTGKSIIDYIVEGKMHYLLDSEKIKSRLVSKNLQAVISKSIENEKAHNKLLGFSPQTNSVKLIDNFVSGFITKLKNTEELKSNIPVNIKHIFKAYLCIQNIYWFRLCNKTFASDADYLEIFGNIYKLFRNKDNQLVDLYNWKKIFDGLKIEYTSTVKKIAGKRQAKNEKISNLIYRKNEDSVAKKDKKDKQAKNIKLFESSLSDEIDIKLFDPKFESESELPEDKTLKFFRSLFSNSINSKTGSKSKSKSKPIPVINYTYLWKEFGDYTNNYFIHLNMSRILEESIEKFSQSKSQVQSLNSTNIFGPSNSSQTAEATTELRKTIDIISKFIEPIDTFIDGRILDKTLDSNPLLLFQVRTTVHLLTTFVGSNMFMFLEKLLIHDEKERSEPESKYDAIYKDISDKMKNLKEYILSDKLDSNKLTFQVVKLLMGFAITSFDLPSDKTFESVFEKIVELLPQSVKTNEALVEKIRSNIIPYYSALYKETLDQLLNFSDSYYRFVKNQNLGILTLKKILG